MSNFIPKAHTLRLVWVLISMVVTVCVLLISNAFSDANQTVVLTENRVDLTAFCSRSSEIKVNATFSWTPDGQIPYQNLFQTSDGNAGLRVEVNHVGVLAVILAGTIEADPQIFAAPIALSPNVEYELFVRYQKSGEISVNVSGFSVVSPTDLSSLNCGQSYIGNGYDGTRPFLGGSTVTMQFVRYNKLRSLASHTAMAIIALLVILLLIERNFPKTLSARVGLGVIVVVLFSVQLQSPETFTFSGASLGLTSPKRIDISRLNSGEMHIMLTPLKGRVSTAESAEFSFRGNPAFIDFNCRTEALGLSVYITTGKHLTYRTQALSPPLSVNAKGLEALTISIFQDNVLHITDARTGSTLLYRSFRPLNTSLSSRSLPLLWDRNDLSCIEITEVHISIPRKISIDSQAVLLSIFLCAFWITAQASRNYNET